MPKKTNTAPTSVDVLQPTPSDTPPATSDLLLRKAVFIYEERLEKPHRHGHYVQGRQVPERVITVCDAREDGTLASPQLIDPVAFADAILDAHHQEDRETLVFQPDTVLAQGRNAVVWWRPAGPAKLYFRMAGGEDEPRYTALNGREIPLPALVFRGSGTGLKVWALAENRRPAPDTPLYGAPFMNIGGAGPHVCLGSARSADLRNATARASAPAEWERIFFESNFTHTPPSLNYNDKHPTYPTLLQNLADVLPLGGPECFPACVLKPTGYTLAVAIAGSR